MQDKKSALVAVIGRPSAGKSTFVNAAAGEKVSIVSPIPQTTRNAVRGIVNTARGQLVFVDTPGYHVSEKKMNLKLQAIASSQLEDADAVLYIIDASRTTGDEEELTAALVAPFSGKLVVALNKIDKIDKTGKFGKTDRIGASNTILASIRAFVASRIPQLPVARMVEMSAKTGVHIDLVLDALYDLAPEGEQFYPDDYYTDQEVDFRIAEIIREQAINRLRDEIPHALYVEISDMESRKEGKELWVRAFLCVERESQKGMVIGKGAALIKTIRVESMIALRKIFPYRIDLDLQVKVHKNWRQKDVLLSKILR